MSEKVLIDERFLSDVQNISGALEAVKAMRPVSFKSLNGFNSFKRYGVVGQSLVGVADPAVEKNGMGYCYVNMEQLIPVLVAAIQELAEKAEPRRRVKKEDTTASGA